MSRVKDHALEAGTLKAERALNSRQSAKEKLVGGALAGGVLAAVGASLCCLGPLVLVSLGFGGAWMANLTALEPYRPLFLVAAVTALVLAYRKLYRARPEQACASGAVCATPRVDRLYKALFWAVSALVLLAGASPYLAPLFY
ncbi:mercuric ion transporter MerT [Pelomicrobium sp. G1]|uniref:mercuric ion transporter MerT n=1 Tax=unclassified Pelomicrobium TaxID=2815318 RepID=UPI003F75E42C